MEISMPVSCWTSSTLTSLEDDGAVVLGEVLDLHVAPGEARPGEVVEEEVRPGLIGLAGPLEVIDLHVIKTGNLAQQAEALARLPKLL